MTGLQKHNDKEPALKIVQTCLSADPFSGKRKELLYNKKLKQQVQFKFKQFGFALTNLLRKHFSYFIKESLFTFIGLWLKILGLRHFFQCRLFFRRYMLRGPNVDVY